MLKDKLRVLGHAWWRSVVLAGAMGFAAEPCLGQWRVVILHPPGAESSWLYAARLGRQGGVTWNGTAEQAAVWWDTAESYVSLHPPQAWSSAVTGLGEDYEVGWFKHPPTYWPVAAALWRGSAPSLEVLTQPWATQAEVEGAHGQVQVGSSYSYIAMRSHASVWRGTAQSETDMTPSWAADAYLFATDEEHFAGYVDVGPFHATLWRSMDPESAVDLHPAGGPWNSWARCVAGEQVGGNTWSVLDNRACIWNGSAAGFVDLHPSLTGVSVVYGTTGEWQAGCVDLHAVVWNGSRESAESLQSALPDGYVRSGASGLYRDGENLVVFGNAAHITGPAHAVLWIGRPCWANCDGSTMDPVLNVSDFACFLQRFMLGDWRANCDGSTEAPVLNVADFACFVTRFVRGCD